MTVGSSPNSLMVEPGPPSSPVTSALLFRATICSWFLQASHRIGAFALLAMLGTCAEMYRIKDFHVPLAIAAGCADIGLCLALVAKVLARKNRTIHREANGVAVFNLVLFGLAICFMVFARLTLIRSAATEFFTPTPPVDVQPRVMD